MTARPAAGGGSSDGGSRRAIRILHVVSHLGAGGLEKLVADLVHRLDGRFESHVLCLQSRDRRAHQAERVAEAARVHEAGPMSPVSMLWPRRLASTVRAIGPDVVHLHSGVWYKASLAASLAGVGGTLYTEHGRDPEESGLDRLLDRLAAARTDRIVAVSRSVEDGLRELGCDPERVTLIRNGIDADRYRPRPDDGRLREELGLGEDRPIIASVGRLRRVKGYDVMIDGMAELRDRPPDGPLPALAVAAAGERRQSLERRVAELGLGDDVFLLGWRDSVRDLYRAATLFSLSSRSEGTSLALLEAMSAGLCPVVTDVGGNPEVLGPELSHRLVPPEDPAALAAGWRDALARPGERQEDARRARRRVGEHYSLEAMVGRYAEAYRALANGHGSERARRGGAAAGSGGRPRAS